MKFETYNISPQIKRSLAEMGFKRPTDIQFKAIAPILAGEDVLAIAQTGTGKTAAFAIPIVDLVLEYRREAEYEGIACLVMVPTRELAVQIADVFKNITSYTSLRTVSLVGGEEYQLEEIEAGIDILVSTPGRMFDLIYQKKIKITKTKILVLDEADKMLDMGFIKDILDVKKFLPKHHQTLFFSATINEAIKDIAYSLVRNAIRIQISPKDPVSKNVEHAVMFIEMDDKRFFLERLINENSETKIMVFVRTQVRAERVLLAMQRVGIKTLTIHGGKTQIERQTALDTFRSGEVKVLIATDVSARGIDIQGVDYVVNYDLPEVPEYYVHRVGRTGRGFAKGQAVSFCSTEEKPILKDIEDFMDKEIKRLKVDINDIEQTIDFSAESTDWKSLLIEDEKMQNEYNAMKKKQSASKLKKKNKGK